MQFLKYLLKLTFLLKMKNDFHVFLFYCEMYVVLRDRKKKIIL